MSTMAGQGQGPGQGLLTSFLAAIQASLSVLLVISYGALSARLQVLDAASAKAISKICVRFFLPALLLTKIGAELHAGSASRYLVVLIWALVCHLVSFLVGSLAHLVFGMPDWITVAIMFNNTTSYPLLLVQSLHATGILSVLVEGGDGTTHDAIERAKSYFLVFATVSSCLTFAVGPRLIDSEHAPDRKENHETDHEDGDDEERRNADSNEATDRTQLLGADTTQVQQLVVSTSFFPSRRHSSTPKAAHYDDRRLSLLVISKRRWYGLNDRVRWWLLFLYDFLNAPLLSAVLGAIIGLVPALHRAFFADTDDGGIFTAWLTASLSNIGSVFVPLPVVIAGVSLYLSTQQPRSEDAKSRTSWLTTGFALVVRFVLWPVVSIAVIYLLASRTAWLGDDPMLWFAMMLMPTGPPAMKLVAMVEVSDADEEDEHKIARLLTVSPPFFPFPPCISWLQVMTLTLMMM
jgi:predicted permease